MLLISATQDWRAVHPGAAIGLLELSGLENNRPAPQLNALKREVETRLRERCRGFTRQDFLALPVMAAYQHYYKNFKKTYHVQLQVESIVLKGKNLPDVSPLVDTNFLAEVETWVLTAGHDTARLLAPVTLDVSREGDHIVQLNGEARPIRVGDMVMRDAGGVSCSILYGQDNRSPITPRTTRALYVAYAPSGVPPEAVEDQFQKIEAYIRLFSPQAVVENRHILTA